MGQVNWDGGSSTYYIYRNQQIYEWENSLQFVDIIFVSSVG